MRRCAGLSTNEPLPLWMVLEANREYWAGKPDVDELIFRIIPEPSTRVAELLTGGVDVTFGLVPQEETRITARSNLRALWVVNDRGWMLFPRIRLGGNTKPWGRQA